MTISKSLLSFVHLFLLVLFIGSHSVSAQSPGDAPTPAMGWMSYGYCRFDISEAIIEAQAQALVNSGLPSHGYQYVNVDVGWYLDPSQSCDANGRFAPNSSLFPDGMAALGTYLHSKGLKFGIYVTPGIPVAAYNQNTPIQGTSYTAKQIVSNTSTYEFEYSFNGQG